MAQRLCVKNLSFATTEADLRRIFGRFGKIVFIKLITDFHTGQSRGFAFVGFAVEAEAQAAIQALNKTAQGGRTWVIEEARPQAVR